MLESTLKDHLAESRLFVARTLIAALLVLIAVLVLALRLAHLQIDSHAHFSTLSQDNRVKVEPLPPTRGLIYDAKGVLLADNHPSYFLEITPDKVEDLEATINALRALVHIDEKDLARFERLRQQHRRFEGIPIRTNLSPDEVARVAVNGHRFPGATIRAQLLRSYPYSEHTAHVLNYVGRINEKELEEIDSSDYAGTDYIGKGGVEKAYEDILHGSVGFEQVEVNAKGRVLRVLESRAPRVGKDLKLFLDIRLQQQAATALGERRGAVVAMDPRTGGVLALVSRPSFDPNLFVEGIGQADYEALRDSIDTPLFDRAIRGQYPPGSTIKPFVGLGGLETGTVSFTEAKWCPGFYQLPGNQHKYRDWKRGGHGSVSLEKAIVQSCDVYFYRLAHDMGIDRLHDFLRELGFGKPTGADIFGERGGLIPSRAWKERARNQPWFPGETLILGIGQGYALATPLQLAAATSALAARGRYVQPRLVRATEIPGAEAEREIPARAHQLPYSANNLDRVIEAMRKVVESPSGTAKRIRTEAYSIAGKTGTAQVFTVGQKEHYRESEVEERMRDHALFVAFAPVEDPRIAVAVIVENGGHGGSVAAPVARQVMDAYLLGVKTEQPQGSEPVEDGE